MTRRENILRAARFEDPDYIPISFVITPGCWDHYPPEALNDFKEGHPLLFPGFKKTGNETVPRYAPWQRKGITYTDSWGCVWETAENGITGAVVRHPLSDWSSLSDFTPPSPDGQNGWRNMNWPETEKRISLAREKGDLASGSLRHGHTFLTLTYLRGYENLVFDMVDEHPKLRDLIAMVEEFNLGLVRRYVKAGVEWMGYPEDLGMQQGPMLSPGQFRAYIKPTYQRLIQPARESPCAVHMHSDGDIRALASDLLDVGIDVLNIQDLVNGIDWIAATLKNRVCLDIDIDRQSITRFGSPGKIEKHILDIVKKIGSKKGGLMLTYGLYPGVPLANVKSVMHAMEKYCHYFS